MSWITRCLILLFIVLQPLRGIADMQAASCEFANPLSSANSLSSVASGASPHAHHHAMAMSGKTAADKTLLQDSMKAHDSMKHDGQHGKSCASCCQACGPALSASLFSGLFPTPIAPDMQRAEWAPASPVENRIRPPIV